MNGMRVLAIAGMSVLLPFVRTTSACAQQATIPPINHWKGEAHVANQSWQFELTQMGDSLWLRVPSLWSPMQPVKNLSRNGRRIHFDFPLEVGTAEFDLDPEATTLAGSFQTPSGELGSISLVRNEPISIAAVELEIKNKGFVIAGSRSVSPKPGRKPAVIIVHGGGNSCRADSPPYRFWGEYFAARGYVAVTYDKRGNGASTGSWKTVGFEERADDVQALVKWLRKQPDVDPERVGLFAVSQGTWVASLVAARDSMLAFVVQVSGPLVTPYDADTYAALTVWRGTGLNADELNEAEHLWQQEADVIRHYGDSAMWIRYRAADLAARRSSWYPKAQYVPSAPHDWFVGWYHHIADFDPVPYLRKTKARILWLYGDADTQSDIERNVDLLEQLRKAQVGQFEVVRFPDTGHGMLAPVDGFGKALGPLSTPPGFFDALERWLAPFE